jgi:hypothetical protein
VSAFPRSLIHWRWLLVAAWVVGSGCHLLLPETAHEPIIRNPFPQLGRVAVAPFFNHSDEPTLDGRDVALAYYAELQSVQGFEVIPVGLVEEAMIAHQIDLSGAGEARRLAELLGADVVVVGAVTDYQPYYPPRVGLRVEWYAANPGFHPIPAGYGLPWGTPEEEFIPDSLVYESQLAVARTQLAEQTPDCRAECQLLPPPPAGVGGAEGAAYPPVDAASAEMTRLASGPTETATFDPFGADATPSANSAALAAASSPAGTTGTSATTGVIGAACQSNSCIGAPVGIAYPAPSGARPACQPYHGPVLTHTQIYDGMDHNVTQALQSYAFFHDDERIGGWQSYMRRSDDYMRFCCHLHIAEMLSARGGGQKTRLVWRWPDDR